MSPKFAKSHFDTPNAPFKDFYVNKERTTDDLYVVYFAF